jgi:KAP family P-loop domain
MATPPSPISVENEAVRLSGVTDAATVDDKLGFEPYVAAIGAFLTAEKTQGPLTLSIEGPWGSGKSSFMLQLDKVLLDEHCRTIKFNAWRHDKEDALWAAFALETLRQLRSQVGWFHRLKSRVKLFQSRYEWSTGWPAAVQVGLIWMVYLLAAIFAGYLAISQREAATRLISQAFTEAHETPRSTTTTSATIPTAKGTVTTTTTTAVPSAPEPTPAGLAVAWVITNLGGAGVYFLLVGAGWKRLTAVFGNPFEKRLHEHVRAPDYDGRIAFIERFQEDFTKVIGAYNGAGKLYVFIDDLDRCEIPKAADLMKALNLMIGEDSRLVFIIGMDRARVAAGLAVTWEKLLPYLTLKDKPTAADGLAFGHEFIEKFIQLPFLLPTPRAKSINEFVERITETPYDPKAEPATAYENLERHRRLTVKVESDSATIRTIVRELAPALHNNPRRIKYFLNLFRLQVYIGHATGLFDQVGNRAPVTLYHVGKIVAITLRWPQLLEEITSKKVSLDNLERAELPNPSVTLNAREREWLAIEDVALLFKTGITGKPSVFDPWTLSTLDLDVIRRVAPRIVENPEEGSPSISGQVNATLDPATLSAQGTVGGTVAVASPTSATNAAPLTPTGAAAAASSASGAVTVEQTSDAARPEPAGSEDLVQSGSPKVHAP